MSEQTEDLFTSDDVMVTQHPYRDPWGKRHTSYLVNVMHAGFWKELEQFTDDAAAANARAMNEFAVRREGAEA